MANNFQNGPEISRGPLPAWWRHLLIGGATLLFCSCKGQMLPVGGDITAAGIMAAVVAAQLSGEADEAPPATDADTEVTVTDTEIDATRRRPRPATPAPTGTTVETLTPTTIVEDDASIVISREGIAMEAPTPGTCNCPGCQGGGLCFADPCNPRLIGPSDEYLCDGGDFGLPVGVRRDWSIIGLEQEDAVAHYDTIDGRVIVTPSNRVCIYAPRFAAVRRVVNLMAHEHGQFIEVMLDEETPIPSKDTQPVAWSLQRHAPKANLGQQPASLFRGRQQAGGLENLQATMDAYTSLGAYADVQLVRAGILDNSEKPRLAISIQSAIAWTGDQAAQVVLDNRMAVAAVGVRQAGVIYQTDGPDNPRLRLVKLASRTHALPGEEVEFTLRFDNIGDQVIGNVTIVDNLATRLEYVPKSAQSTVDANFITAPNSGGSTILRWEIKEPVKAGDGGILRFRAKVR